MSVELMGAGRHGQVPLGSLQLSFAELLAMTNGGDLLEAPLRLRSPRGVTRHTEAREPHGPRHVANKQQPSRQVPCYGNCVK